MSRLVSLSVVGVLALGVGACDEQPTDPETTQAPTVAADHGVTSVIEASADLMALNTTAAADHGFRVGEKVGTISVMDDGSSLVISGTADGLDPDNEVPGYASLFYDVSSSVHGPEACEPRAGEDHVLHITDAQMFVGVWVGHGPDDGNGSGTLLQLGPPQYVPVDRVGTVSIRDLRINGGFGPDAVVACGRVTHDPAG